MPVGPFFVMDGDHIGGFDKRPFQIRVAVGGAFPGPLFAGAFARRRHQSGVAGQILRAREPPDVADLKRDHAAQNLAHAGQRLEQVALGRAGQQHLQFLLALFDLLVQVIDGFQLSTNSSCSRPAALYRSAAATATL